MHINTTQTHIIFTMPNTASYAVSFKKLELDPSLPQQIAIFLSKEGEMFVTEQMIRDIINEHTS